MPVISRSLANYLTYPLLSISLATELLFIPLTIGLANKHFKLFAPTSEENSYGQKCDAVVASIRLTTVLHVFMVFTTFPSVPLLTTLTKSPATPATVFAVFFATLALILSPTPIMEYSSIHNKDLFWAVSAVVGAGGATAAARGGSVMGLVLFLVFWCTSSWWSVTIVAWRVLRANGLRGWEDMYAVLHSTLCGVAATCAVVGAAIAKPATAEAGVVARVLLAALGFPMGIVILMQLYGAFKKKGSISQQQQAVWSQGES